LYACEHCFGSKLATEITLGYNNPFLLQCTGVY